MFSVSRTLLVTFLLLLQLVAPLVHAHASNKTSVSANSNVAKLHIPGLEILVRQARDSLQLDAINMDPTDGIVVGINTGITPSQDKNHNAPIDSACDYFLFQATPALTPPILAYDIDFSPPSKPPAIGRLPIFSHSQRAPPTDAFVRFI